MALQSSGYRCRLTAQCRDHCIRKRIQVKAGTSSLSVGIHIGDVRPVISEVALWKRRSTAEKRIVDALDFRAASVVWLEWPVSIKDDLALD